MPISSTGPPSHRDEDTDREDGELNTKHRIVDLVKYLQGRVKRKTCPDENDFSNHKIIKKISQRGSD